MSSAEDATAKGLYKLFTDMCTSHNIDWTSMLIGQSYDGANVMKGQVAGLRTLIQSKVPRAVYIWCNAHQLNLAIVYACSSCKEAVNFLGIIEALYVYFSARKRHFLFKEKQEQLLPGQRSLRFKILSTTRWSSHSSAIDMVLLTYPAILSSLEILQNDSDLNTKKTAKGLLKNIKSFKFILMLVIFKDIFIITSPLSKYLQSANIDFFQAITFLDSALVKTKSLRSENEHFHKFVQNAKKIAQKWNVEQTFEIKRIKIVKSMPGEMNKDEVLIDPLEKFRCDIFNVIMDVLWSKLRSDFKETRSTVKDMAVFQLDRMSSIDPSTFPPDAFKAIGDWLPELNIINLKNEYFQMSKYGCYFVCFKTAQ